MLEYGNYKYTKDEHMGYEAVHTSSKYSFVSDVLWYLSQMSWIEISFYVIAVNIFAYLVKKKLGKKA